MQCGTPTEGAKRRREERRYKTCGTPTEGAKRRREERRYKTCGTPTEGAKRRREERRYKTCGTPTEGAKRRREELIEARAQARRCHAPRFSSRCAPCRIPTSAEATPGSDVANLSARCASVVHSGKSSRTSSGSPVASRPCM